jgi:hypothetical protein
MVLTAVKVEKAVVAFIGTEPVKVIRVVDD